MPVCSGLGGPLFLPHCLFTVLLEYFVLVVAPYIDISGRWMMLFFCCLFATDQAVLLFVESTTGHPIVYKQSFFLPNCQFSARGAICHALSSA